MQAYNIKYFYGRFILYIARGLYIKTELDSTEIHIINEMKSNPQLTMGIGLCAAQPSLQNPPPAPCMILR